MKQPVSHNVGSTMQEHNTRFLHPKHIAMIDEALGSLGEYGEIRLIVEKGRLRFLVTQKSFDALKWLPGSITRDDNLGETE